jgi:hypothetical protein
MREPNWLPYGHILEPPCLGRQVGGEQVPLLMLFKQKKPVSKR